MKWILDRNKSLKVQPEWRRLQIEMYDLYELLKKSRKLRYDYDFRPSEPYYPLTAVNRNNKDDIIQIEKFRGGDRDYLVVSHYRLLNGSMFVQVSQSFYHTETEGEKLKRINGHNSGEHDSSQEDYEFSNPAWGDYPEKEK